jgi:glucans biosynthesis protein C
MNPTAVGQADLDAPGATLQNSGSHARSAGPDESPRFHELDAVRAFALLLGVVFHAAESFGPNNYYWAVVDCSPSSFLEWCRFACHSFRLELFFVIAGFFARLLLVRRGTSEFVRNRTQRILVPLVVGWFLLYPVLVFIWTWGWSVSGRLQEMGIPPEAKDFPAWKLTIGFFLTGGFLKKFDLTHLWFLHQLLFIYLLVLGVRWIVARLDTSGKGMLRCDSLFGRLNRWPGALIGYTVLTIPMLLLMRGWTVDTPKESLIPQLPTSLLFGFCFLAGWLWNRQTQLLEILTKRWQWHLAIGAVVWILFGLLEPMIPFRRLTRQQLLWTHLTFATCYALMMWALALGFLGVFGRFCANPSPWRRYVTDASYWIYIVHLPLVVALQVALGRLPIPWPIKYPFICVVSLVLLFLSYHYLVRTTFIGVQLNGRRYPCLWPWQNKRSSDETPVAG